MRWQYDAGDDPGGRGGKNVTELHEHARSMIAYTIWADERLLASAAHYRERMRKFRDGLEALA